MDKLQKIEFLKEYMEKKKLNKFQCSKELKVSNGAVLFWLKAQRQIPNCIIELIKYKMN